MRKTFLKNVEKRTLQLVVGWGQGRFTQLGELRVQLWKRQETLLKAEETVHREKGVSERELSEEREPANERTASGRLWPNSVTHFPK